MISKGYVGVFSHTLHKESVRTIVSMWLDHYDKVEQVCPGDHAGNTTLEIRKVEDLLWETNLQFRVLSDANFTWAYLNLEGRVIETSGMPDEANTMPLEILLDLPGLEEVVDQINDKRLDELEREGVM